MAPPWPQPSLSALCAVGGGPPRGSGRTEPDSSLPAPRQAARQWLLSPSSCCPSGVEWLLSFFVSFLSRGRGSVLCSQRCTPSCRLARRAGRFPPRDSSCPPAAARLSGGPARRDSDGSEDCVAALWWPGMACGGGEQVPSWGPSDKPEPARLHAAIQYTRARTCMRTRAHTHVHACTHMRAHAHTCTRMHTHVRTHAHTCTHGPLTDHHAFL